MRENGKCHISVSYCRGQISFCLTVNHPACMYSSLIQEIGRYQAHVIGRPNILFEQGIIEWNLVGIEIHFVSSQAHTKISDPDLSSYLAKEQNFNRIGLVSSYCRSNHTIPLFLKDLLSLNIKEYGWCICPFLKFRVYVGGGNKNYFHASVVMKSLFLTW